MAKLTDFVSEEILTRIKAHMQSLKESADNSTEADQQSEFKARADAVKIVLEFMSEEMRYSDSFFKVVESLDLDQIVKFRNALNAHIDKIEAGPNVTIYSASYSGIVEEWRLDFNDAKQDLLRLIQETADEEGEYDFDIKKLTIKETQIKEYIRN